MIEPLVTGLEEGCKLVPAYVGAAVLLRLAHFPDFGIEGSFTIGAATAAATAAAGAPTPVALAAGFAAGIAAGAITATLYVFTRLHSLICGIVTFALATSASFFVMGASNLAIDSPRLSEWNAAAIGLTVAAVLLLAFSTRHAVLLRVAGESPALIRDLGRRPGPRLALLLVLGNAIVAMGGACVVLTDGSTTARAGAALLFQMIAAILVAEALVAGLYVLANSTLRTLGANAVRRPFPLSGTGAGLTLSAACIAPLLWKIGELTTTWFFGANDYTPAVVALLVATAAVLIGRVRALRRVLPAWNFHGALLNA